MTNARNAALSRPSTVEVVATGTSAVIILTGLIYWGMQIRGVMEMLAMAYG